MASIQAAGAVKPIAEVNKTEDKGMFAKVKDFANNVSKQAFGEKGAAIAKEALKGAVVGAALGTLIMPGPGTLLGAAALATYKGGKEAAGEQAPEIAQMQKETMAMTTGAALGTVAAGPLIGIPLGVAAGKVITSEKAQNAFENMKNFIMDKLPLSKGE